MEIKNSKEGKAISFNLNLGLKIAAGITLLVIGYFLGVSINTSGQDELAQLKDEMEATKQLVMLSLTQESASQRIKGVSVSQQIESSALFVGLLLQ